MCNEINDSCVSRAWESIRRIADSLVKLGVMSEGDVGEVLGRISVTDDPEAAFRAVQFIQENAPENYEIKRKVLENIEAHTGADTIIASSTSGLLISEIARDARYPERCLGAHPYNPPHLIPLVEMTKGERTDPAVAEHAAAFYRSVGKEPVILEKERLGFIANRISHAVYREVIALVEDGVCTVEGADKAVCYGPGLRWAIYGPNLLYELGGGLDGVAGAISKFRDMSNLLFEDISDMKRIPDNWLELAVAGVKEEKAALPGFMGSTNEELGQFRDRVLVELLKLHQKL